MTTAAGARLTLAAAMAAGAAAVGSAGMVNSLWLQTVYGPMCGPQGHGLIAPHCPACPVAAALMLAALVLGTPPLIHAVRATVRFR